MRVSLDHVGIVVPSLDRAAEHLAALGFAMTARAEHTRVGADGRIESAGSAQRSVVLGRGYIEVQEITDPLDRHLLSPARAKHHGLHIVAFGVPDAEAARAALPGPLSEILAWTRPVREADVVGDAEFAFFVAPYEPSDDTFFCWVEHRTPQLVRPRHLLAHANGALGLDGIWIAARDEADRGAIARRYVAAGGEALGLDGGIETIVLGEAKVLVASPAALPDWIAERPTPHSGRAVALEISFEDPMHFAAVARSEGLATRSADAGTAVALPEAFGLTIIARRNSPGAMTPSNRRA